MKIPKGGRGGGGITKPLPLTLSNRALYGTIFFITILMATTAFSITFSRSLPICLKPSLANTKHFRLKSQSCPLWSSSFSFCLHTLTLRKSNTNPRKPLPLPVTAVRSFSSASTVSGSPSKMSANDDINNNPLLKDFDFPPFDSIEAKHVRPGIRALLQQLVCGFFSLFFIFIFGFWGSNEWVLDLV